MKTTANASRATDFLTTVYPLADVRWSQKLADRFWSHVDRVPSGCWEWRSRTNPGGYGLFHIPVMSPRGPAWRMESASRLAYEMATGERLGQDDEAMHACDNPPCIRPHDDHVRRGTAQLNGAEKASRGRSVRGARVHTAKFTAEEILAIRERYAAGHALITELAAELGVGWNSIEAIVHGRSWRDVGGPITASTGRIGSRHPASKLTEKQVTEIKRRLGNRRPPTHTSLAREHGVTKQVIGAIVRGRIWKHVQGPRTRRRH